MNLKDSRIFVDSSIWLEILEGSEKGERAKEFLTPREFITSSISIAEVERVLIRNGMEGKLDFIRTIIDGCSISVDKEIARRAAILSLEKKLGLADAIIAASSEIENATLYTGDHDFENKGLEVIILD